MTAFVESTPVVANRVASESLQVPDALVQLKVSHRLIEDQFETYSSLVHVVKKQNCLNALCASMTVHVTLLAFYFHPAVMFVFDDPAEFARQSIVKYARFKELLAEMERSSSAEALPAKFDELRRHFQQHVKEEETVVFPRIRKSPINLTELGETIFRARAHLEKDIRAQVERKTGLLAVKDPIRQHNATLLRH